MAGKQAFNNIIQRYKTDKDQIDSAKETKAVDVRWLEVVDDSNNFNSNVDCAFDYRPFLAASLLATLVVQVE